ncbi:MAG TPA: Ig-like domain repeat protein [Verrucomicrobiae bacterium]|nr:Ig-like domain repeat protein [Verrucomicrobiae bacterium]
MNAIWGGVRKPCLSVGFFLLLMAHCAFGQAVPQVVPPVDNAQRVTLSGNVHPLARAEFDRGATDSGLPMNRILLLLKRSDAQEAALQTYMEQQQDKSSANYHVWLTPAQFGGLYGPADSDIQAVTQWLASQGFTVNKVYSGKTVIEFSGTVAQVQAAFGTAIHNFQVNDKTYVANATDPQIPAALAPVIAGIVSLNDFPHQSHMRIAGQVRKIAGKPGLQPLFTFPFEGTEAYGVGPADFATIYNSKGLISAGNNGSGQTIAVVGETDINVADVQAFRQSFGLPANFTTSNIILNGEDPGITSQGEEAEADLDVQWSGAVAPGATIDYVVSESTPASAGIDLSALYIIEYNLAGVMSESYGDCESALGSAGNAFYNAMWEQAAAQGITVVLSAGDGGSAGCDNFDTQSTAQDGLAVSGLASTPYNVAVGGTDFDDVNHWSTYWSASNNSTTGESVLSYIPEIPWNQNCAQISLTGCASPPTGSYNWLNIVAGSGGASSTYGKPTWQVGVAGMPNDSHRDLPDVSLFASAGFDNSAYVICAGDGTTITGPSSCSAVAGDVTMTLVGGTSASTPAFAGVMALVNQKQSTTQNPAPRQGNANHVLYALAKKAGASCASTANEAAECIFNDITHGNSALTAGVGTNSVPCTGGTPNCSETVASESGVLVEPANAKIEAYTVTAGYDLVTGLGSVNIGNLATNWSTVNTVATATTLTLSPITGITHGTGEDVTVNIAVTPTTGTATGDVSLIATIAGPNGATTQGLDQFTLSSGKVVNATTNSLPGGTSYQVHAHYAGDGTNAPSDSTPVTVTVGTESSQTFIVVPTYNANGNLVNGNASTVTYGSLYLLSMYVTDKNAVASTSGPPTPACYQENILTCPTGTVSLTDGGIPLGTGRGGSGSYYLNSAGHTENLNLSLTGGTHTLVATYSGDNSYQGNTSASTNLTVTPAPTQTQMEPFGGNGLVGQSVTVSATIAGQGPRVSAYPGGTITFYDGTTVLPGTVQFGQYGNAESYASINTTFSAPGDHKITAQYGGDQNYAPSSTSSALSVPVLIPTTITLSSSATAINYGQSITLTAVTTSNTKGAPMTGNITFNQTNAPITTTSTTTGVDSNGNQMLTTAATTTPQGNFSAYATYGGDSNYAYSISNTINVSVNIPDFSLSPPAGLTVVAPVGQSASGQITVTPATQTPSSVTIVSEPSLPIIVGYSVTLSPQQVSLNGAAATATVTVVPNTSSTNARPSTVGKARTHHAGLLVVDRDSWFLSGLVIAIGVIFVLTLPGRRKRYRIALGLSALSLLLLALGCGGGGGTGGGGGGGGGGGPQATTVTLSTSNAKVPLGTSVTITATVTGNSPSGNVIIYDATDNAQLGVVTVANGQAQMPQLFSDIGVYQITASYSGDAKNQASNTTAPLAQAITGTITATLFGNTGDDTHSIPLTVGIQ